MAKIDLLSKEWADLIFHEKNKKYGAYEMRLKSPKRHMTALVIVVAAVVFAFSFQSLMSFVASKQKQVSITEVNKLSELPPPEVKNEEIKTIDAPPPPPLKSSLKYTVPKIEKDENIRDEDQIKSQDDIIDSKVAISIADVKGTDELTGQDIAEIRDIAATDREDEIFDAVEDAPMFPGGEAAMRKFLANNQEYPYSALERGIQGRVFVQFMVSKTGKIERVTVMRGIDPACDKEAVRLISSMPDWIPGRQNGRNVNVWYRIPIVFQIQNR